MARADNCAAFGGAPEIRVTLVADAVPQYFKSLQHGSLISRIINARKWNEEQPYYDLCRRPIHGMHSSTHRTCFRDEPRVLASHMAVHGRSNPPRVDQDGEGPEKFRAFEGNMYFSPGVPSCKSSHLEYLSRIYATASELRSRSRRRSSVESYDRIGTQARCCTHVFIASGMAPVSRPRLEHLLAQGWVQGKIPIRYTRVGF